MPLSVAADRYEIDEKNAIIALQSILSSRDTVPPEKFARLSSYLNRLPPYRVLLVYGQALHIVANRMDEDDPQRQALKELAQSIMDAMSPELALQIEENPAAFEDQRHILAENLHKIASFMQDIGQASSTGSGR